MQTKVYIFSQEIVFYGKINGKMAVRLPDKLFSQLAKSMNADLGRTELFNEKRESEMGRIKNS
ncbi:MAG: hypothetical protein V7K72_04150 [Nostoc sp.]|uniref:hypothetical protein n=1 Tax=Nostoc sp. TaxID=1180 RepID=UPI002FFB4F90